MDTTDFTAQRLEMVNAQIVGRGLRSEPLLKALREVPREVFLPSHLREFAYEDSRLPLADGRTVPRAWVVAAVTQALALKGREKVLEVGVGCGYGTAVLAALAKSVHGVEPSATLAAGAAAALGGQRVCNAHVRHGSATDGWPEQAPFDAILVNFPGQRIPEGLKRQLKVGGRLVMAVGTDPEVLELLRVTRTGEQTYEVDDIAAFNAGALISETKHASSHAGPIWARSGRASAGEDAALARAITACAEKFATPRTAELEPLMRRIGEARLVLLGEATHGTAEFYRMRDRITRDLIEKKGFSFVAIEGDWPDAARIDHYVRDGQHPHPEWAAFSRFPTWMWRNRETRAFVDWLRAHNRQSDRPVAFHGLDLYSMYTSIRAVLSYLDHVDKPTADLARHRYGCLTPWQSDPAAYGRAALTSRYRQCEDEVVANLTDLSAKRAQYAARDGDQYFDALQNARLVANAERYYRTMYYGSRAAWNLRDSHMFETLRSLLTHHGDGSKGVVWAHNTHLGDSAATEMSLRGEFNLGHLCRKMFGKGAYAIGFGTNSGTVAAASDWDAPMETKAVRPGLPGSYEKLFHETGCARFLLPLSGDSNAEVRRGLSDARLERAIGVIYKPESERHSHYFDAVLPLQFDEYIWFDETQAVFPLRSEEVDGLPDTYPFGL